MREWGLARVMGIKFLRSEKSRTGYIYPDNYMGSGMADVLTIGACSGDIVGKYERALVLGRLSLDNGSKYATAVKLLDVEFADGSAVYGVVPENELFIPSNRDATYNKSLQVGSITTVRIDSSVEKPLKVDGDPFEATYECSRRAVLQEVQQRVRSLQAGDVVLGRVCGRGRGWTYKVDIGGGYRVWLSERGFGKHSVHSRHSLSGSLVVLERTDADGNSDVMFAPKSRTFDNSVGELRHGVEVMALLTRTDGTGCVYAYIPNCGFIYVAGYVDDVTGENVSLKFGPDGQSNYSVEGKAIRLGSVVALEVVHNRTSVCGYIKYVQQTDALSDCVML